MTSQSARRVFKTLLRTEEKVFAKDLQTLKAAKVRTREAFRAPLPSSTLEDKQAAVAHARSVVHFLLQNVAQATRIPPKEEGNVLEDRYKIHIDPHRHELGDNETIRAGRKNKKTPSPCNSSKSSSGQGS
ncbi:hypothetical protein BJ684DRAFT_19094 [Piptocephalis cylindrospora]|uniref:Mitochondrial zinc maintenance protein 1, mitochondrial n=1 Tax=Piptocephalis cylindrospora TaxID=1907219 RepID=A0A4P9Y6S0_9FUNG|nr:hypothetical protein BJ684DRAFT_19094 [Piptocephalis cylindrospora]|eukprot:RKP14502.1 hypothetical protein BJ684DRAFT_19094 [Piptocephalis cylindrospora]